MEVPLDGARRRAHPNSHPPELIPTPEPDREQVRVAELTGHTSRVLHMAQSPDGTTICSAAADETLRFWKILSGGDKEKKEKAMAKDSMLTNHAMSIR